MKTDTLTTEQQTELRKLIDKSLLVPYKEVFLKRRYWDGGDVKYKWEAASVDLKLYLKFASEVTWNLDTEELNVFRTSNVTLELYNENATFEEDNASGLMYGKILKHSLIQIKAGYKKVDGTKLLLYVFSGIIENYRFTEGRRILTLAILGMNSLLDFYSAEDLADNQVTGENIGTGDDSTKDFYTSNEGVGKVKKVYVDGEEQVLYTEYSVAWLNDKDNYAEISFVGAPGVGTAITCDYTYWYQGKRIHYLVKKLVESTGLTPADYDIENVEFDNVLWQDQDWDSEAEFNACQTKQGLEVLGEGSVRQPLSSWIETTTAHFNAGVIKDEIDTSDDKIRVQRSVEYVEQEQLLLYGYVSLYNVAAGQSFKVVQDCQISKIELNVKKIGTPPADLTIELRADDDNSPGDVIGSGTIPEASIGTGGAWELMTFVTPQGVSGATRLWVHCPIVGDASNHYYWNYKNADVYPDGNKYQGGHQTSHDFTFKIYEKHYALSAHFRSQEKALGNDSCFGTFSVTDENIPAGCSIVYKARSYNAGDWGDWLTVSDGQNISSLTPASKVQYDAVITTDGEDTVEIADVTIQYIDQGYSDTYCKLMTQDIDCAASLETFGLFERTQELNGQTLKYYTQSAPDDSGSPGTWESEVEISANGQINSTCDPGVTRFLRGIVYFKTDDATERPLLQKIILNWSIASFAIALADFTGLTVRGAIEELARMPNYECGFDATGKYFFRSRDVTEVVDFVIDWKKNLDRINEVNPGVEFVRNHIEAVFGDFTKIMDVRLEGETRPDSIDKYGYLPLSIYGGNLLASANVDIATGICMRYYGKFDEQGDLLSFNLPEPKQRVFCSLMFVPQLDLSDVVEIVSDPDGNPLWLDKKYKVIGMRIDLEAWRLDLSLQEV